MQVKCDGRVGIGTTNPTNALNVIRSSGSGVPVAWIHNSNNTTTGDFGTVVSCINNNSNVNVFQVRSNNSTHANGNGLFTIKGDGKVGIGTTNPAVRLHTVTNEANTVATFENNSNFPYGIHIKYANVSPDSSTTNWFLDCQDSTTSRLVIWSDGDVQNHDGTYGTLASDLRLKENIVDATGKLKDLMSLEVKNYNFIGEDKKMIGFVAQDFEKVFPSLVTTNDTREYDDDENIISGLEDSKGLKVGVEFAILTKAIQEQQTIIEDLKARIETLENK